MQYYTKTEVCHLLKITNRQLQHLLVVTGIVPTVASNDKRMQLIASTDYERLSERHVAELRDYVPGLTNDESVMSELEQMVINMREEMNDIQQRLRMLEAGIPQKGEDRPTQRRYAGFTQRDDPPSGMVWRDRFAEAHGVPRGTAVNHIRRGHFSETTQPSPSRSDQENHFLDGAQQRAAVAYWRVHYEGFKPCPECPHLEST